METVATIAEVLAWIGLATAALFGLMALLLRVARGPWDSAPAVRVDGGLRWMAADGSVHGSAVEHDQHIPDDDLVIYYRTRRPETCHLEKVAHDERGYRFVALILAGIGVVGVVVSTVASFL